MKFQRFSSIDNSYRSKTVNLFIEKGLSDGEWTVGEKIHGSNFSLWCDGEELICAKRGSFLKNTDNFFNNHKVMSDHRERMSDLFVILDKEAHGGFDWATELEITEVDDFVVYGEIFGGWYPHPDVEKVEGAVKVQKGIYYSPRNEFYAYDIKVNGQFINDDDCQRLLKVVGIFNAEPLFRGTFRECLDYPNEYQSTIAKRLGLPVIEDNICEGNVIRPVHAKYLSCGSRVILKNKNDKWSEKMKGEPKEKKEVILSEAASQLFGEISSLVTENRLRNVLSKTGPITQKEFGKLLGLLMQDAFEEFNKDWAEDFAKLGKDESKTINKMANQSAAGLIRTNFLNIIDETF
jgi:Rnl2 family RNA ligase